MARRGNYGSEKRQKEIRRKARRDAKLERRHAKAVPENENEPAAATGEVAENEAPPPAPDPD